MIRNVLSPRFAALLLSAAVIAPAAASAQDWTGFYYGLNIGVGPDNVKWSNIVNPVDPGAGVPGPVFTATDTGFAGGIQVGYNQQMGPWVWGAELGFDAGGISASTGCLGGYQDYHATCGSRSNWMLDFSGRLGGTVGPALLYVKAGGRLADEVTFARNVTSDAFVAGTYKSAHNTPVGYVFGFGAEVALTDDMSAALEYDYASVDFTADMTPAPGAAAPGVVVPFRVDVTHQSSIVTARLNFRL